MINLPILRQNERKILNDIIRSKNRPAKTRLLNVYDNVLNDYLKYFKNRRSLEKITADTDIDDETSKINVIQFSLGNVIE